MSWIFWPKDWVSELDRCLKGDRVWGQASLLQYADPLYRSIHDNEHPQTTTLMALSDLEDWQPYPHQTETAIRILFERNGRAILADETGLGKTIEAGLVLKELILRGRVKNALILSPSSLVFQWARELNQKFNIPARVYRKPFMWSHCPFLVTSLDTAKRAANRQHVMNQSYDLIIVDEAHQLKNPKTANHQFIRQLRKKHCLLLTATPVQNELKELYHLADLLRPGHWSDPTFFRSRYADGKRGVKNVTELIQEIRPLWIRNRRSECGIDLPPRSVEQFAVELTEAERQLYEAVTNFVCEHAIQTGKQNRALTMMMLQREVCSSRDALFLTLAKWFGKLDDDSPLRHQIWELIALIKAVDQSSKSKTAIDLIRQRGGKFIIFTAFRATQEHLMDQLMKHGIPAISFFGKMKRGKRDWMIDLFEKKADVLVATDAGSEGLNLQHCHQVINYDLPWNPMRLEQRIGRVHRIGQTKPVQVTHLVVNDSIEAYILQVLSEKTALIDQVVGPSDPVMQRKDDRQWMNTWFRGWLHHSGRTTQPPAQE